MAYTGRALEAALEILRALPDGTFFDSGLNSMTLDFQASGDEVTKLRQQLPAAIWRKAINESFGWFEYTAEINGLMVRIYADRVGPAACRKIVEEVEVEKDVPVAYEKRMVKEKRTRWECPEESTRGETLEDR